MTLAQATPASATASAPRYGDLPLRRDADADAGAPLAWVGFVLLVVVAALFVWRRRAVPAAKGSGSIQVGATRPLTAQASLHVVEWEGERLLIACTPQMVQVLVRKSEGESP